MFNFTTFSSKLKRLCPLYILDSDRWNDRVECRQFEGDIVIFNIEALDKSALCMCLVSVSAPLAISLCSVVLFGYRGAYICPAVPTQWAAPINGVCTSLMLSCGTWL